MQKPGENEALLALLQQAVQKLTESKLAQGTQLLSTQPLQQQQVPPEQTPALLQEQQAQAAAAAAAATAAAAAADEDADMLHGESKTDAVQPYHQQTAKQLLSSTALARQLSAGHRKDRDLAPDDVAGGDTKRVKSAPATVAK